MMAVARGGPSRPAAARSEVEVEVGDHVRRVYDRLTGSGGAETSTGLWVVVARLALGRHGAMPPGGVLLSLSVAGAVPGAVPERACVEVCRHERPTSNGRRLVTVSCRAGEAATVTFVLLLPPGPDGPAPAPGASPEEEFAYAAGTDGLPMPRPVARAVVLDAERTAWWSRLTRDPNPLHTSRAYAASTRFAVPIVQGHYLAALVADQARALAGHIPLDVTCDFVRPVPVGSRIEIDLRLDDGRLSGQVDVQRETAVRVAGRIHPMEDPA